MPQIEGNIKIRNKSMYLLIFIPVGVIAAVVCISVFLVGIYIRRTRKKIKEDLPKVQFIRALLSSTKDEDEIPIENMLISKPMASKRQFEIERLTVQIE